VASVLSEKSGLEGDIASTSPSGLDKQLLLQPWNAALERRWIISGKRVYIFNDGPKALWVIAQLGNRRWVSYLKFSRMLSSVSAPTTT
jgi:hypothetical protein